MKITGNKIYFSYILLGLFYIVSKVVFYVFDFVYLTGVVLGLVATMLTILSGIAAFKEYDKKISKLMAHWLTIIFPLVILIYTPLHMTLHLGIPVLRFPIEKLAIFLIFECLAVAQLILAAFMFKGLRETKKDNRNH